MLISYILQTWLPNPHDLSFDLEELLLTYMVGSEFCPDLLLLDEPQDVRHQLGNQECLIMKIIIRR